MPVMSILTPLEQDAYSQPPVFSHVERKRFCAFPSSLLAIANTLRAPHQSRGVSPQLCIFSGHQTFLPGSIFSSARHLSLLLCVGA